MKVLFTFLLTIFSLAACAQRVQAGVGLIYDVPFKPVMSKMTNNGGEGLFIALQPAKKIPLYFTFDVDHGNFSNQIITQTFLFGNKYSEEGNVKYVGNFNRILIGIAFFKKELDRRFRPYVNIKFGRGKMKSDVMMTGSYDPSCMPVNESRSISSEGFIYVAGGGVQINMSRSLSKAGAIRSFFDLGISVVGGSKFDYINARFMPNAPLGAVDDSNSRNTDGSKNIAMLFENIFTGETVNDKIAEVYTLPMMMISFHIGYTIYFVRYKALVD